MMMPGTLNRLRRLRSMTRDEIAYRVGTSLRTELDRVRYHLRVCNGHQRTIGRNKMHFRSCLERSARRFYLPPDQGGRERLRQFIENNFPEWKTRAVAEAERICEHRIELLGYGDVELGSKIDWHRDPITGRKWPRRFWANYDLVRESTEGDPKIIHELNRHQHLPRLGKAYFLTGDERYAEEAVRQMVSWIEQNRCGMGIHWHSSLEISSRVLSWLWTIFFVLPAQCFSEAAARRIGASLFAQVDHVCRYPSLFSSPNTHLLGEATALYIAGVVFAEWPSAARWRQTGHAVLLREIDRQVNEDGVHAELSTYYHCYALDFYLQALCLMVRNGRKCPPHIWQRVASMADFLMHITRPDGSIPRLGDDDGGRALALSQTHYGSFQDALCSAAVLYRRPDFKHGAGSFREETLWLLGEEAWSLYWFVSDTAPHSRQAVYPSAGYVVQRSDWSNDASHLVFDCGGMGMLRGGHGHADALSITLFAGGRELLLDPGAGVYNGAREWRNYFRSSRAHNTAVVDGAEQSEVGETFSWSSVTPSRVTRQIEHDGCDFIEGEHTGYNRLPQKVLHRRAVLFCRPDIWIITDRFAGEGTHRCDVLYHFAPRSQVEVCGGDGSGREAGVVMRTGEAGLEMFLASSTKVQAELIEGRTEGIQGWMSRRYGHREPAPTLQLSLNASMPVAVMSILVPFRFQSDGERMMAGDLGEFTRLHLKQTSAIAYGRTAADHDDLWIAAEPDQEISVQEFQMRGEFFWLRRKATGAHELFAVNASYFACDGRPLLHGDLPVASTRICWNANGRLPVPMNEGEEKLCVVSVAS